MRIMLSCGEPSGDVYAGGLVAALLRRDPTLEIVGFGGPRMQEAGAELLGDYAGLSVAGLTEVLRAVPRSWAMLQRLTRAARDRPPDVFVPIDYFGFNARLATALKARGVPVVYYVSPQLWAWRPNRMRFMQRVVDRMLVIFPFEASLYTAAGVPVEFVGHPLLELARSEEPREVIRQRHGLSSADRVVAVLPGSRDGEVRRLGPELAAAMVGIRSRVPGVRFLVAAAPGVASELFGPLVSGSNDTTVIRGATDDVLASADVAVTASGTATVQATVHGCPMGGRVPRVPNHARHRAPIPPGRQIRHAELDCRRGRGARADSRCLYGRSGGRGNGGAAH